MRGPDCVNRLGKVGGHRTEKRTANLCQPLCNASGPQDCVTGPMLAGDRRYAPAFPLYSRPPLITGRMTCDRCCGSW